MEHIVITFILVLHILTSTSLEDSKSTTHFPPLLCTIVTVIVTSPQIQLMPTQPHADILNPLIFVYAEYTEAPSLEMCYILFISIILFLLKEAI